MTPNDSRGRRRLRPGMAAALCLVLASGACQHDVAIPDLEGTIDQFQKDVVSGKISFSNVDIDVEK